MDPHLTPSRRELFRRGAFGLGGIALGSLLAGESRAAGSPKTHHPARAKRVIFLHMSGGPSQVDLFDPKPALNKYDGKPIPAEFVKGIEFGFITGRESLLGSPYRFAKHGRCGMDFSDSVPHLAGVADELTMIRGTTTDEFNHANAQLLLNTGFRRVGRPGMGAWLTYGLGTENADLPGFVVLASSGKPSNAGTGLWSSGFLPTQHQGVPFSATGDAVPNLGDGRGVTRTQRADTIDAIARLNRTHLADVGDPEIATRIGQYELAFRMQTSVPDLMDVSRESRKTLEMYGADPAKPSFANNCLLARRLVERGVRFVQVFLGGWDHHQGIYDAMPKLCKQMDRPCAALVRDLRQRGLLDDTVVVWAGEFGRTPMVQDVSPDGMANARGRDHHKDAFTVWVAGGGFKPGLTYGETDEFGCRVVKDPVHVHDLQATLLHQLGLDHTKLTYRYQGRDFRLTDVHGRVVKELVG
ncbi:MAG: sulfatase [Isosphaera sp.]|nr:sulfatase [Isosphaera sp.]